MTLLMQTNLLAALVLLSFIISLIHAFSVHRVLQKPANQYYHHHARRRNCLGTISIFQSFATTPSLSLTNENTLPVDSTDDYSSSSSSSSLSSSSSSSSSSPWNARFLAAKALMVPRTRNNNKQGSSSSQEEFAVARLEADYHFNNQLSLRDRGFARLIVSTVERRMGQIDKILDYCSIDTVRNKSNNNSKNNKNDISKKPKRSPATKSRVDEYVEAVLRVGAVQLLFLDTSPHAAVKETVDLLRIKQSDSNSSDGSSGGSKMVVKEVPKSRIGYVNAVLRRISKQGPELLAMTSVLDNVSPWLLKEWNQAWSNEATLGIVNAAMHESPRCLSVRQQQQQQRQSQADELHDDANDEQYDEKVQLQCIEKVAALFPNDCQILPQGSIRIHTLPSSGSIANWPLYTAGAWWLQDVSSTLPAMALYKTLSHQNNNGNSVSELTVIDLCAAPGGKTAQLCNYGFGHVIAVEKSLRRSKRLEKNLDRLQFIGNTTSTTTTATTGIDNGSDNSTPLPQYSLVVVDGTKYIPKTRVAGVLLDAPCTATGTASKRPDVLRRNQNFQELLDTQYQLACHAVDNMLNVDGGILVYATCSLLKQEGEEQIKRLLARNNDANNDEKQAAATTTAAVLETVPFVKGEMPGFDAAIDVNGWLRVIPGGGTTSSNDDESTSAFSNHNNSISGLFDQVDGFFVARLRRVR